MIFNLASEPFVVLEKRPQSQFWTLERLRPDYVWKMINSDAFLSVGTFPRFRAFDAKASAFSHPQF